MVARYAEVSRPHEDQAKRRRLLPNVPPSAFLRAITAAEPRPDHARQAPTLNKSSERRARAEADRESQADLIN